METLSRAITQHVNLESIMLSKISQPQNKYCIIAFIGGTWSKFIETEKGKW